MIRLIVFLVVAFELFLALGSYRVLIQEQFIGKGEKEYVKGWGMVDGNASSGSLICTYFNGIKTIQAVKWYSPNDIFGASGCHILEKW